MIPALDKQQVLARLDRALGHLERAREEMLAAQPHMVAVSLAESAAACRMASVDCGSAIRRTQALVTFLRAGRKR